jgi:hypothetical protein
MLIPPALKTTYSHLGILLLGGLTPYYLALSPILQLGHFSVVEGCKLGSIALEFAFSALHDDV